MPTFEVKADIKEGMSFTHIKSEELDGLEFVVVKCDEDGELYGLGNRDIIKISEANMNEYVITDLFALEEEREYTEVKLDDSSSLYVKYNDENMGAIIEEALAYHTHFDNDDFVDIPVRKKRMTGEEYIRKTQGDEAYFLSVRKKIKAFYDKAEEITKGHRRVKG